MHLDCGACQIRSCQVGDEDSLAHHGNDRDIWVNLRDRFPHPYTHADAENWIRFASAQQPETAFAIVVAGQAAGGIEVKRHDDIERCAVGIGYWIGCEFWGRGIMTAAVRAFTSYAFRTYELTRIYALAFADNVASRRVLEKAGYRLEGVLHRSAIKDGKVRDQAVYALTDEWWRILERSE